MDSDVPTCLSRDEIHAFAGEGWGGYERYYVGRLERLAEGGAAGFNGAAFLFGTNWCFWRKLYRVGLLLLLVELVVGLAVAVALVTIMGDEVIESSAVTLWTFVVFLAVRVPFGFIANDQYLKRAASAAEQARVESADSEAVLQTLARRGGTSLLGLAMGLALSVAVRVLGG